MIRWNAQTVAARLRVLADDILYHRYPQRFNMDKQIGALEKIAWQHPDQPGRAVLRLALQPNSPGAAYPAPLYARNLMADKERRLPAAARAKKLSLVKITGVT